ncbi:MAG: alkaline phosphatase family protein [Candidatus Baltobacteraceae bacterium]
MRCILHACRALPIAAAALVLSACAGSTLGAPGTGPYAPDAPIPPVHRNTSSNKIKHVVIIVQENRSFDNLFYGAPGADTRTYGYDSNGDKIALKPVGLETIWDLDHSSNSFFEACNGTGSFPGTDCQMNGFNWEWVGCGQSGYPPCPNKNPQYSYVPHSETKPYFEMAKQYVLADRMFASNFDASSFISHQYIIAGQASSAVNYPYYQWGCDGGSQDMIATVTQERYIPGGYEQVCFDNTTLGDELDQAGLSWGFYTATLYGDGNIWSAYQAIRHIYYGKDWKKDIITPQTQFFSDVKHGKLRVVSWITPTCENSDHAGCGSNTGPSWVTALVNAIGKSKYWDTTAVFVLWDDYGGWYDHVGPAMVDYDGLGMRIPMLIISPYAKEGYVSHVHYEHGSILRFVEDEFGLPRLSQSDTRANSPADDAFDFSQPPRKFVTIHAPHGQQYFLDQPPDRRMPDTQ